jgi:hypothetical protein
MSKFRSAPLAAAAFMSLVLSLVLATLSPTHGAPPPAKQDVRVVNTLDEPVPTVAQGSTAVTGTVQAEQSGTWTVDVAGTALTRNADEPARHAFQTSVAITILHSNSAANGIVTVPPGKRLVVEFMSVFGDAIPDRTLFVAAFTSGAAGEVTHELALSGPRRFGNDIYTATHPVRIYADDALFLRAQHSFVPAGPAQDSHVSIGISGYLVDLP